MKILKNTFLPFLGVLLLNSCLITNDMAYPRIFAGFLEFEVEGQVEKPEINNSTMTVNVILNEVSDIKKVKLLSYSYTEGAKGPDLGEYLDLSNPIDICLTNYHDYKWQIKTTQPIERYIDCSSFSSADWKADRKEVQVYLTRDQNLKEITIDEMKLEAIGSTIVRTIGKEELGSQIVEVEKDVNFPMTLDCTLPRKFIVEHKGQEIVWIFNFVHIDIEPSVKFVNPWCYHAEVEAEFDGTGTPRLEYKRLGAREWSSVDNITISGISIKGEINKLKKETDYLVRLVVDKGIEGVPEVISEEYNFKTDIPAQLPNMGFNSWSSEGKNWFPYAQADTYKVWDTANKGVTVAGDATTTPEYTLVKEGRAAAKMETKTAFGVLAAGNIFTGEFLRFDGNAHLLWGTPFTSRPTSLSGWYHYLPKTINNAPATLKLAGNIANPYTHMLNKMDNMQVLVVLFAEGEGEDRGPFPVASNYPGTPDLKNDPRVIAYGEFISDKQTAEYSYFELPLEYKDNRKPAYVIVVACASYYGNYYTGAIGSVLYVDDFAFLYN